MTPIFGSVLSRAEHSLPQTVASRSTRVYFGTLLALGGEGDFALAVMTEDSVVVWGHENGNEEGIG